jgi:ketosteroid isomerase-like protein
MKAITILTFLSLLAFFSCKQKNNSGESILNTILARTKEYNATWDKLNMENVAKFHSDSSFRYYRYGILAANSNTEFRNMAPLWMEETKSLEGLEFSNPTVQVLSENTAIIGFKSVAKIVLKNGAEELDSNNATYVWQKMGNQWKIVHIHESKK